MSPIGLIFNNFETFSYILPHLSNSSSLPLQSCVSPVEVEKTRWNNIKTVVRLLERLQSPYMLEGGSLLFMYRNCSTGLSDIDVSVEQDWWEKHSDEVTRGMLEEGFSTGETFGELGQFGYTEGWWRDGVKVDLCGASKQNTTLEFGLWVNGEVFSCPLIVKDVVRYFWLEGLEVKGPSNMEEVLEAMYGVNWQYPTSWVWDKDPFLTGFCRYSQ